MRESQLSKVVVTVVAVLFVLFCANILLGLGLGILGLFFGLVGGLLHLIFSKEVITLAAIGLVVYLCTRRRSRSCDTYYHY